MFGVAKTSTVNELSGSCIIRTKPPKMELRIDSVLPSCRGVLISLKKDPLKFQLLGFPNQEKIKCNLVEMV